MEKDELYSYVHIAYNLVQKEKSNGNIQYMDPQTGNMDASSYFSNGTRGRFGFFRMDDKALTTDENIIAATVEVKP